MINYEEVINLENHKANELSKSVIDKIKKSGDLDIDFKTDISFDDFSLTITRQNMGKKNIDFTKENINLEVGLVEGYIEIGLFSSERCKYTDKVIYFVHGGGFIGGNFFQYENQLKLIVELTGVPIVAINYRLAPENKFPSSIFDCKKVYDWICSKENEYSWNKEKIIFLGDSAGVNLGLMLVSAYESVNFLSFINIYGCVDLLPEKNNMYQWSIGRYDIISLQNYIKQTIC